MGSKKRPWKRGKLDQKPDLVEVQVENLGSDRKVLRVLPFVVVSGFCVDSQLPPQSSGRNHPGVGNRPCLGGFPMEHLLSMVAGGVTQLLFVREKTGASLERSEKIGNKFRILETPRLETCIFENRERKIFKNFHSLENMPVQISMRKEIF